MRRAPIRPIVGLAGLVALLLGTPRATSAQDAAPSPLVFGGGRITLGGDASLTLSCTHARGAGSCGDDTGFFNYSDYEHSLLRLLRLDLSAAVRANEHLSVLAEIRSENGSGPKPYAFYARLRPWRGRNFDIQAGRVPPTFGAFGRRTYARDNPLIGYPLAYQYLTSLRSNAVPANTEELLRMRGRGWLSAFSLGDRAPGPGVPLVAALRWDTGVQVHSATSWLDVAGAITAGSLANPVFTDQKAGQQFTGRIALHLLPGLVAGASGARGPFLTSDVQQTAGGRDSKGGQRALGGDIEFSRDYYLVRFEAIRSAWTLPTIGGPLRAGSASIEGRYKLTPRFHVAARFDRLRFSAVAGARQAEPWEAPVSRGEAGVGYLLRRNLQLKAALQRNVRDGGRVPRATIGAAQVLCWF